MKDVRKLVPRTPPEGLLEWAAGAKEELDEDVLLIETEWAEDFRLEVILDEWAQRKKVRAIRATCSACTESGLLWRSRDGRGDWGFLHPDSWTEGEGGAVCVDGDRRPGQRPSGSRRAAVTALLWAGRRGTAGWSPAHSAPPPDPRSDQPDSSGTSTSSPSTIAMCQPVICWAAGRPCALGLGGSSVHRWLRR